MRAFAIMCAVALVCSSAFGLTLFKDLNLAGNAITNVSKIELSGNATVANVGRIQFANGQIISNAAPTGDIRYPDGIEGEPKVIRLWNSTSLMYTVPVNRTLYVLSGYVADNGATYLWAATNGVNAQQVWYFNSISYKTYFANKFHTPLIFPERTVLRTDSYNLYLTGIEVPRGVETVVLRLDWSTGYTVPAGKKLYVMSGCMPNTSGRLEVLQGGSWWPVYYFIDNNNNESTYSASFPPLVFNSGARLRSDNSSYPIWVTGYLK